MNKAIFVSVLIFLSILLVFPVTSFAEIQSVNVNDNVLTGINHFEYAGSWLYNYTGAPNEYNADLHLSKVSGDTATFFFTGTEANIFGVKADYFGIAGISLDGGAETMVDEYSPTIVDQAFLYSTSVLPNGPHTLRIRVTGNQNAQGAGIYVLIDRAVVTTQAQNTCSRKSQGDANCDGAVNLIDFEQWRKEFTGEASTLTADFNGDGAVNLIDFELWRRNLVH